MGRSDNSSLEYVKRIPSPVNNLTLKKTFSEPAFIQKEQPKKVLPKPEERKNPDKNNAFVKERWNMFASSEYEPFENFKSLAMDGALDMIGSHELSEAEIVMPIRECFSDSENSEKSAE